MCEKSDKCGCKCSSDIPKKCDCGLFLENWSKIHNGLIHSALNGVATVCPPIKFCPWCGGTIPLIEES